jgi:hypothetical protein
MDTKDSSTLFCNNSCSKCKCATTKTITLETELIICKSIEQHQKYEIKNLKAAIQRYEKAIWDRDSFLSHLKVIYSAVYNANRVFEEFGLNTSQKILQKPVGYERDLFGLEFNTDI